MKSYNRRSVDSTAQTDKARSFRKVRRALPIQTHPYVTLRTTFRRSLRELPPPKLIVVTRGVDPGVSMSVNRSSMYDQVEAAGVAFVRYFAVR
jgi:hypothetical protein